MSKTDTIAKLTSLQSAVLFVVQQNEPVSVADVAYHLHIDAAPCRSRLATLERRGLVTRTYTGHYKDSLFAFSLTGAGAEAMAAVDAAEDEAEGCWMCGRTDGTHMRACAHNPNRVRR